MGTQVKTVPFSQLLAVGKNSLTLSVPPKDLGSAKNVTFTGWISPVAVSVLSLRWHRGGPFSYQRGRARPTREPRLKLHGRKRQGSCDELRDLRSFERTLFSLLNNQWPRTHYLFFPETWYTQRCERLWYWALGCMQTEGAFLYPQRLTSGSSWTAAH